MPSLTTFNFTISNIWTSQQHKKREKNVQRVIVGIGVGGEARRRGFPV